MFNTSGRRKKSHSLTLRCFHLLAYYYVDENLNVYTPETDISTTSTSNIFFWYSVKLNIFCVVLFLAASSSVSSL